MKKLLTLLSLIPTLLFGQTTPKINQVLGAGNDAQGKQLVGLSLVSLKGSSSGTVAVNGPAAITTYTFTLPPDDGTSGQFLQTDGAGVSTWQTVSTGLTVGSTAISGGTNPYILYNNGGVLGNLQSIPIANGGTNNTSAYTAGSVVFSNGTSLTQDNTKLFWDDGNNRLGVGTATPSASLDIVSANANGSFNSNYTGAGVAFNLTRDANTTFNAFQFITGVTSDWLIGQRGIGDSDFHIYSYATSNDPFKIKRDGTLTTIQSNTVSISGGIQANKNGQPATMIMSGGDAQLVLDRAATSDFNYMQFTTAGAANWLIGNRTNAGANSDFTFYSYGTGGNVFQILNASGYVGVGAVAPLTSLHVSATYSSPLNSGVRIQSANGSNCGLSFNNASGRNYAFVNGYNSANLLELMYNSASGANEPTTTLMSFDAPRGLIGVGLSADILAGLTTTTKFIINGNAIIGNSFLSGTVNAPSNGLLIQGAIKTQVSANNKATVNPLLFASTTDAATAVELTTDGNVGSGATNRIAVPVDGALSVVLNICVKQSGSANAKQMLRQFLISNNGGTTALQGAVTTLGTDVTSAGLATVTTTITANDTDDCVKIEVNGVIATNLRYTAYVVSCETIY